MKVEKGRRVKGRGRFQKGLACRWMREKGTGFQYKRRILGVGRLPILGLGSPGRHILQQEQSLPVFGMTRQHLAVSGWSGTEDLISKFALLAGDFRRMRRENSAHAGGSQAQGDCHTDENFTNPMIHARPYPKCSDAIALSINDPSKKGKRYSCLLGPDSY